MKSLKELFKEHDGYGSDKWEFYLDEYSKFFSPFRNKLLNLLEIGIQNGGSLEIWGKYFSNGKKIVGCDIDTNCSKLLYTDPRIHVVIGNVNTDETESRLTDYAEDGFDIIIDDGSHSSSDIIETFCRYFKLLKHGGLFVVEDLHCSYWQEYEGGLFYPYSSMSFFKRLIDVINQECWGVNRSQTELLEGICSHFSIDISPQILTQIHSVEFSNSLCLIQKAPHSSNRLGERMLSGHSHLITDSHPEITSIQNVIPLQSENYWSRLDKAPDELFERVSSCLEQTQLQLQEKEEIVSGLQSQLACKEEELADFKLLVSKKEKTVADLQSQLLTKEKNVTDLQSQVLIMRETITDIQARILANEEIVTGLRTQLLAKEETVTDLRSQLLARENTITDLQTHLLERDRRIEEFLHSSCWRLTKPLRDLVVILRNFSRKQIFSHLGLRKKQKPGNREVHHQNIPCPRFVSERHTSIVCYSPGNQQYIPPQNLLPWFNPLNIFVHSSIVAQTKINVLLPSLAMKNMSGGPNTVLIISAQLAKQGHLIRLISTDVSPDLDPAPLRKHIHGISGVAKETIEDIEIVDGSDRAQPIVIGESDIFIASAWWTAQMAKHAIKKTRYDKFVYIIQDYEPLLHAASSGQSLATETYSLNYVPIINTRLLFDYFCDHKIGRFSDQEFAVKSLIFEPAVSSDLFYPSPKGLRKKKTILFYARPTIAHRNLFEIGVAAIQKLIAENELNPSEWNIWGMGEQFSPIAIGHGFSLEPLPWLGIEDYAKQIRDADILLSLMLSPHPSYPPLEMAAAGGIVVTNTFSTKTGDRLREISKNILAAEPVFEDIADKLKIAIQLSKQSHPNEPGRLISLPHAWHESLEPIIIPLSNEIHSIQKKIASEISCRDDLLNSCQQDEYGDFRRYRLAVRRLAYEDKSVPGLLSFLTSVWNTQPAFLECLAESVFSQDNKDFEWILLDNGSTNPVTLSCLEKLKMHPCVRYFRVEENRGIIGGMRFCLEQATSRYILPLDSDDYIYPDCVRVVTGEILANDFPPLLYTDEDRVKDSLFFSPYLKPDWDPVLFANSCYIAHLCIIDRKMAFTFGCYTDSSVEGSHDWDTFTRFYSQGYEPLHIPEVLYSWRVHENSCAGDIGCKSYIMESQRNVLAKLVHANPAGENYEIQPSPLFNGTPDHWIRRKIKSEPKRVTITWGNKRRATERSSSTVPHIHSVHELLAEIQTLSDDIQYVHLIESDVEIRNREWADDWFAYFELYPDTVVVGGLLHDENQILFAGGYLGFGWGNGCPDTGRMRHDVGYFAQLFKPHSVNAVSSYNILIQRKFLEETLCLFMNSPVSLEWLGSWLGAEAQKRKARVVYTPFLEAATTQNIALEPSHDEAQWFRFQYGNLFPDTHLLSPRVSLQEHDCYIVSLDAERDAHLKKIKADIPSYELRYSQARKNCRLHAFDESDIEFSFSIITTIYQRTDPQYFRETISSVCSQTYDNYEWIVLAHGIIEPDLQAIIDTGLGDSHVTVYQIPTNLGIIGGLNYCLHKASKQYIIPLDSDDLLDTDALAMFHSFINKFKEPDFIYGDEDILQDNLISDPYIRPDWDKVLNMTSSYIWHLTAFKRDMALSLGVYTDSQYEYCHDWDTVSRFSENSCRIEHIPYPMYHWRRHATSLSNSGKTNSNSTQSVEKHLEGLIKKLKNPSCYEVKDFPIYRGVEELTILRKIASVPDSSVAIISPNNLEISAFDSEVQTKINSFHYLAAYEKMGSFVAKIKNAIAMGAKFILYVRENMNLKGSDWLVESLRLIDSDDSIVIATGRCIDERGTVLSSAHVWDNSAGLIPISSGANRSDGGPYAMWLKPHRVLCPNPDIYFSRAEYLKKISEVCPQYLSMWAFTIWAGLQAYKDGKIVGYSPLIEAYSICGNRYSLSQITFQQRKSRYASTLFSHNSIPRMSIVK